MAPGDDDHRPPRGAHTSQLPDKPPGERTDGSAAGPGSVKIDWVARHIGQLHVHKHVHAITGTLM